MYNKDRVKAFGQKNGGKIMKKLLALVLILAMAFTFAACGVGDGNVSFAEISSAASTEQSTVSE